MLAWTKATNGGRDLPTEADRTFLGLLDLEQPYIILGQHPLGTFHRCKRLGWARLIASHQWLLTEAGRVVLETQVHERPHPAEPALPSHDGEVMPVTLNTSDPLPQDGINSETDHGN